MTIAVDAVEVNSSIDEKLRDLFNLQAQIIRCWSEDLEGGCECVERCVALAVEGVDIGAAMQKQLDGVEARKLANVARVEIVDW